MTTTEPKREPPPTLQGRYRLVRTLEEGKRGTTYLGYDIRLHRWRAIDVPVDDASARRLSMEAELLAKLEHPALERVVDLGEDGPISFVVRDRLQGSAASHLPMRPAVAAFVVQRIADGLAHAHGRGILHGHLRPSVIRFSDDGSPVLTGFGDMPRVDVTASGRMAEGWAHLAPEVRERGRPDVRAETYSLGALLYTLLAGRHQPDLSYAEAYDGLLAPIPAPLRPVIVRACAHDPNQRPPDAETFRGVLSGTMERLGSLGDVPWRADPLPDTPPEWIIPDLGIQAILQALGPRPTGRSARSLDVEPASTMDTGSKTTPYNMPELYRKDPGFRDPFSKVDAHDLPSYVDAQHAAALLARRPSQLTVTPQGSTRGTPAPVPRREGSTTGPVLAALFAVVMAVFTVSIVAFGGVVGFWAWEAHQDEVFVESVLAERGVAGLVAESSAEPEQLKAAWFRLTDHPSPENAAAYVRLATPTREAVTTPTEVRASVERMQSAMNRWQGP